MCENMAKFTILMAAIAMIAHVHSREITMAMSNLGPTYNELVFILQSRFGEPVTPPKHLTPCARAILGCCNNNAMNENCSEKLNCGAHFFDDNPCSDKFITDALEAAKLFYDQFNTIAPAK